VTNKPNQLFSEREDESANFKWFSFAKVEEIEGLVDSALYRLILKAKQLVESER
jgi:hypothetical protein